MKSSDVFDIHYPLSANSFYSILKTFNRRSELERLVIWAKKKHLKGPFHLYQSRLIDEERRLLHYRYESPRITAAAKAMHQLAYILFPPTRYPAKGSARGYKRQIY